MRDLKAKKYLSIGTILTLLSVSPRLMCGGGNAPPNVGDTPIIWDISLRNPEMFALAVWGPSGYVQAEAACVTGPGDTTFVSISSGPRWFAGGGDSLHPAMWLYVECPWYQVILLRSSIYGWGWD